MLIKSAIGNLGRPSSCDSRPLLVCSNRTLSPDKLRDTLRPTSGESHDDPLPCPNGLSEVRSELVLELYGSLRTGRREVSGGATRPDHGRRHAAETLGRPSRPPYDGAFAG